VFVLNTEQIRHAHKENLNQAAHPQCSGVNLNSSYSQQRLRIATGVEPSFGLTKKAKSRVTILLPCSCARETRIINTGRSARSRMQMFVGWQPAGGRQNRGADKGIKLLQRRRRCPSA
jgi:hypothetical protein